MTKKCKELNKKILMWIMSFTNPDTVSFFEMNFETEVVTDGD